MIERLDSNFHLPEFKELVRSLSQSKHKRIAELVSFSSETWNQNPEMFDNEFPYIEISAIDIGSGDYTIEQIPISNAPSRAKMIVRQNDIIISTTRPHRGAIAWIKPEHDGFIASTGFAVIRKIKDEVDKNFLFYLLRSSFVLKQFLQRSSGGNYPAITQDELEKVVIPVPSLNIQRALGAEMESARKTRQAKLSQADELLQGMDAFVLEQLGLKLPKEDNRSVFSVKLGDTKSRLDAYSNHPRFHKLQDILLNKLSAVELQTLATEIFSGTTPTAGGNAYTEEANGVPFVRSGEITTDGKVAENIELLLKPEVHDGTMKRSQLKQGDLLIAIVGATIGAVGVYDRKTPANINQAIAGVRLKDKVLPEFVCWYLKSSAGQAFLDFLKRPVARANINLEEIGQILVPVPKIETQKMIIDEVESRRAGARRLHESAEREWKEAKMKFEKALLE